MATTEAQASAALESSASAAAGQEEAPREPGPEAAEPGADAAEEQKVEGEVQGEGEEGDCGLCLFMEAGDCKDAFVAWLECIEAAREGTDMAERCQEVISNLTKCMEAHADFYAPVLQVEQALKEGAEADAARGEPASDSSPPVAGEGKEEAVAEKV